MKILLAVMLALTSLNCTKAFADEKMGLHHESELNYIVVGGNARSQSFSGKQATWYQFDNDLAKLSGHYLSTSAQNQSTKNMEGTAENWSVAGRWEHIFIADKFNLFAQAGMNGDRFVGIKRANSYDIGVKYFWLSDDTIKLFSEAGYQYKNELLSNTINGLYFESNLESNFLRLFTQLEYAYNPSIKFVLFGEYLPDIKHSQNYRVNFGPSVVAILSDTFSLKFGYEGYYRNTPVEGKIYRLDFRHVTALIAKF